MRLLKEDTAALLVDVQERLVPAMAEGEKAVAQTVKLLKGLAILNIPLVAVRQYPKGLGDFVPELKPLVGGHPPLDKLTFSAWDTPEIASRIRALGKKTILVFGMEAHVCVQQTVLDLLDSRYTVALVADCTASRNPYDREIALRRMEQAGAMPLTCEAALFELLRAAGTDTFKQISQLVK